jgi:thymidine kinase
MTTKETLKPDLIVYAGPMFAGKTSALIKAWETCECPNKIAFKYNKDTRYESGQVAIISHDRVSLPAIPIISCAEINTHLNNRQVLNPVVVFIDEGQFFPDIHSWYTGLDSAIVTDVYVSGLDYDIFGKVFSKQFDNLMECATVLYTHTAKCHICNEQASRTQFIDANQLNKVEGNVLIGGEQQFQPACEQHFKPCVTA